MFICKIADELPKVAGFNPDPVQVGTAWLPIKSLTSYRLYPKILRGLLVNETRLSGPVYLGDLN